jgi:hypothetical protein
MPLVITDQDVLTVIATDDEIATDVDAAFTNAIDKLSTAALVAWQADLAAYRAWAVPAKASLEGGFFFGQWSGVPDAYNQALNWGSRLRNHAKDAAAAGADVPNLPDLPAPATPTAVTGAGIGTDTKLLIALVAIAVIVVARKL